MPGSWCAVVITQKKCVTFLISLLLVNPGFKSRTGLNFFQVLFTTTRFSSVLSCEDLLISSTLKMFGPTGQLYYNESLTTTHLSNARDFVLNNCHRSTQAYERK